MWKKMRDRDRQEEEVDYDQLMELETKACDALALQFSEPIIFDYPLPSPYHIQAATGAALRELCGFEGDERSLIYENKIGWTSLANIEKLERRVLKGIRRIFSGRRDKRNSLDIHMQNIYRFGSEWFPGYGTLYRYRPGERKKAQEENEGYWREDEQKNFGDLGEIMREYIRNKFEDGKR